eukprot:g11372.t1
MAEWVEMHDESSGQKYYQNTVTGESSWEKPEGFGAAQNHEKAEATPDKPQRKKLTKEEREAQKAERLKRRAEQLEKKRLRDIEREKIRKMEEEIEKKRRAEEARQRKIRERQEALEKIQYTLLTPKQQNSLADKGIRAVKQNSMGGVKVYLAEVELRKGGFEGEDGQHYESINAKDYDLNTPLHVAAKLGYLHLVKMFLGLGMDPSSFNASGMNAMHLAIAGNNLGCLALILMSGKCDHNEPSKTLRCRSVLESGFRCPNDQVEGGFCESRACKETGNDMMMEAMKAAREKNVKFDIGEYNKQEDADLSKKVPMIIAKLRKCPQVALFLQNFSNGGVEICRVLNAFEDSETIEAVKDSLNDILTLVNESKSKCNENIRRRNVYKDRASTINISGRPFYDMISCWRSLLSALLEDPKIANVYGHVLRYENGVTRRWEALSRKHQKRFKHNEWTDEVQSISKLISSKLGDVHETYSYDKTLLQDVDYNVELTEDQKQALMMQQINSGIHEPGIIDDDNYPSDGSETSLL